MTNGPVKNTVVEQTDYVFKSIGAKMRLYMTRRHLSDKGEIVGGYPAVEWFVMLKKGVHEDYGRELKDIREMGGLPISATYTYDPKVGRYSQLQIRVGSIDFAYTGFGANTGSEGEAPLYVLKLIAQSFGAY